ncbi:MAG: hypothetical protein ACPGXZ_07335 [Saprospiraceae bacterium]
MNTKARKFLLLLLIGFLSMPMLQAQQTKTYYDYNKDWTFGIHGGFSWQNGDLNYDRFGGGLGLTLGKRVYGNPGSAFAWDWRARLLYSNSFGQGFEKYTDLDANELLSGISDAQDNNYSSLGYAYTNYRTDMVDLDFEGVLTLNRLRERTGVVVQLFGGLGLNFYETTTDQLNNDGLIYDYGSIDSTLSASDKRGNLYDLRNEVFRDGNYETSQGTRLSFMPTWGFGLGYQPVDWFSFGVEHRFGYPVGDDKLNGVEGDNLDRNWVRDIHNLSYLYARFHFGVESDCLPPSISVTSPTANPYSTQAPSVTIDAEIREVSGRNDLEVTVNNLPNYSYSYSPSSDRFSMPVLLQKGENVIRIVAKNSCEEEDVAVIRVIYNPNVVAGTPPTVTFTSPSTNQYSTYESSYNLAASVKKVATKNDLTFTFNGKTTSNFSYRNNVVKSNLDLRVGTNTVQIKGVNNYGEDVQTITIIRKERAPEVLAPRVTITDPSNNPFRTRSNSKRVVAKIEHVDSKSNVQFTVNGRNRDFSYNTRTGQLTSTIQLERGTNTVVVTGSNSAGTDQDDVRIIFEEEVITPPTVNPPKVTVTRPRSNTATVTNNRYEIVATIRNVNSKNQVGFKMNGRNISAFSYNSRTDKFTANVTLEEGANVFEITGSNSAGRDADGGNIIYKKNTPPAVQPPTVQITTPNNGAVVTTNRQVVKATVRNVTNKSQITFKVNGQTSNIFSYNATSDRFESTINLVEGQNTIEVSAANTAGRDQDNVNVIFRNPQFPPVITVTRPATNPATVTQSSAMVQAGITNITMKSQLTFKVNGRNANFTWNPAQKVLSSNVALNEGANRFEITATNGAGNDQKTGVIVYKKPVQVQRPTVNITVPSQNPFTTTKSSEAITATIRNVASATGVSFVLNGRTSTNFTYNPSTGQFNATVSLKEGSNNFKITGTNTAGSANDSGVIIYRKPVTVSPPQVAISSPNNNTVVQNDKKIIVATVKNVTSASDVTFIVNGSTSTDFTFNVNSKQFRGNATLKKGANRIEVKGRNTAGQDADNVSITYKPIVKCDKPTISMIAPTANPFVALDIFAIRASVNLISGSQDIKVTANGITVPSSKWSYTNSTKLLDIDYTNWKPGKNILVISATNSCGTTTKTVNIVFNKVSPPAINFTKPIGNGGSTKVTVNRATISANITNASKSDISLIVNGISTRFNFSRSTLVATAVLKEGKNIIQITATNAAAKKVESVTVNYDKPTFPPKVTFTSPSGNTTVKSNRTNIKAIVKNIDDKSAVIIMVNGKRINSFSFLQKSGAVSFNANLKEGDNNIQIAVRNKVGADVKSITVKYQKKTIVPSNRGTRNSKEGKSIKKSTKSSGKAQTPKKPKVKKPSTKKPVNKTKVKTTKKPKVKKPSTKKPKVKKPSTKKPSTRKSKVKKPSTSNKKEKDQ